MYKEFQIGKIYIICSIYIVVFNLNKGKELKFLGFSVDSKTSKAVQISDIILGMFNFDSNKIRTVVKFYKM